MSSTEKNCTPFPKLIQALREKARAKMKNEHDVAVAKEIEYRRQMVKANYKTTFNDNSQHTDMGMTFWLNRVGDPPKRGVPEEKKGIRRKNHVLLDQYEQSRYRQHAQQNFIYWP